jgi:hypothetical protein
MREQKIELARMEILSMMLAVKGNNWKEIESKFAVIFAQLE